MADQDVDDLAGQLGFRPTGGGASPPPPSQAAAQSAPAASDDPDVDAMAKQIGFRPVEDVGLGTAVGRAAARGVLPALGGVLGGAAAGAAATSWTGPGSLIGGLVGAGAALVGGGLTSYGVDRAQSYGLSQMPDDWQEAIGQSDRQQRLSQEQHPYGSFLGGLAPFALTMKPWGGAAPENATNFERLTANPAAARLISGAVMGGVQLAQDVNQEGRPDWARFATATTFGLVFAHPTDFGQSLERAGARLAAPLTRRPGFVVPPAVAEAAGIHIDELTEYGPWAARGDIEDAQSRQAFEENPEPLMSGYASDLGGAFDQGQEYPEEHTLASLWDGGRMGPGMTNEVALGWHDPDPTAAQQAREVAKSVTPPQIEDPDVAARRMEPELFADYDRARNNVDVLRAELQRASAPNVTDVMVAEERVASIQARLPKEDEYQGGRANRQLRAEFRDAQRQLEEVNTRREAYAAGEATDDSRTSAMRAALLKADEELRDTSRKVSGVRKMAAERVGAPVIERAKFEEPPATPTTVEPAPQPVETPTLAEAATQPTTFEPITPAQNKFAEPTVPARLATGRAVNSEPTARAAASTPRGQPTTPQPTGAQGPRTLDEQRAAIADDVAQRMRQSGRPDDEARRWGEIAAEHYVTRAARMRGGAGSAEDLYRQSVRIDEAAGAREKRIGGNVVQGETARRAWPRIVRLFKDADASTVVHENGHVWLDELQADAAHELATDVVKRDWETASRWLKIRDGQPISRGAQERFARSFEQYMREGVAPTARLAYAFERFKVWLTKLYKTIDRLGEPINDEVRGVFDRLLTEQPEYVTIARERPPGGQMWNVHTGEAINAEAPDADALADRMAAERLHAAPETPEAADEIQKASTQVEDQRAAAAGAADAGGEAAAGGGGSRALEPGGGAAGNGPDGGGMGGGAGAQRLGGNAGEAAGAGLEARGSAERTGRGPESFPLAPRGKPALEHGDTPWIGRKGNLRTDNLTNKDQLVAALKDISDRTAGTDDVVTMNDMISTAEQFGLDSRNVTREHLMAQFGGVRNLARNLYNLRKAMVEQSQHFFNLTEIANQTGKDEDVLTAFHASEQLLMMNSVLSPATTEIARGLGMGFRNFEAYQTAKNATEAAQMLTGKPLYQLKMMLKMSEGLNSPAKINKWLRDSQQRSFGRMMLEYWVNGLISGFPTHSTYTVGLQVALGNNALIETPVASMIGQLRSMMGREGDSVVLGEALAKVQGYFRAYPKAAQAAIEGLHTGLTTALPDEAMHTQRQLAGDVEVTPEMQDRFDRFFLDERMKTTPKNKAEATRRAKEMERLKDVEPLNPFGESGSLIQTARTILHNDVTWKEVQGDLYSLGRGIKDAFIANGALAKAAGDPNVRMFYPPGQQTPNIAVGNAVFPIGGFVTAPSRGVAALHSANRVLSYSMEISAQAWRQASSEGLTGDAFNNRIQYLRQNPSQEMMAQAHETANLQTLMGQGGALVKMMSRVMDWAPKLPLLGETPVLRFINPFVKIAANIMDQTFVKRTPLGLLSPTLRADLLGANGNVRADMAAARMLTGSLYATGFGLLAMEGYITGSGPLDRERRNTWIAAGNQPHSFRIGDSWYDVHRLGPLGLLLGIGADLYDVAHIADEGQFATAAAMFNHAIVQNMLDESFLRGPADFINMIENPAENGERWVQSQATNLIPWSVGMGYTARSMDPYTRMTRDVVSAMKAKLPGVSETLLPRVDLWGNDTPSPTSLGGSALSAIYEKQISQDPVSIALDRAGIGIASSRQFLAGVQLSDQQFYEFSKASGAMLHNRLAEYVAALDWQYMDHNAKQQLVSEIVRGCRETARGMLYGRYPDLATKSQNVRSNRYGERF